MTEAEIQEYQQRIEALTAQISELKATVATGIEEKVPPELKNLILIAGVLWLLKRPWMLALSVGWYVLQSRKASKVVPEKGEPVSILPFPVP